MTAHSLDDQLTKYLTDAHCIERQALVQMKLAPRLAADAGIARAFTEHRTQTEEHERAIAQRLHERGAEPSAIKDALGVLSGAGFGAFAAAQPDTPGKLVVHAYSYEHMEEAAYDLLARVAERAQDTGTASTARTIEGQEREMGERLEGCFEAAVVATLRESGPADIDAQLNHYLSDAHAIEGQAHVLLGRAGELQRLVAERLAERGASPSKIKDAALALGAVNWGAFFAAQPDTPAKLAAFTYAFEHLEIAGYELLARVAQRAGDQRTVEMAQGILAQEHEAAQHVRSGFEGAIEASLGAVGALA